MSAAGLVRRLGLRPHPEGGFYKETYRADAAVPTPSGPRAASTAILYLLEAGQRSRLHRLRSDELWHFHEGGPLAVVELVPGAGERRTVVGPGRTLQHAVAAGTWFGAEPEPGTDYALVGCTVAPGFDFADFELGDRNALLKDFPEARGAVLRLTEPG